MYRYKVYFNTKVIEEGETDSLKVAKEKFKYGNLWRNIAGSIIKTLEDGSTTEIANKKFNGKLYSWE